MFAVGDKVKPASSSLPIIPAGTYSVVAVQYPPNVCAACGENWDKGRSNDCIFYCSDVTSESDNQPQISLADETGEVLMWQPPTRRSRFFEPVQPSKQISFFASSYIVPA